MTSASAHTFALLACLIGAPLTWAVARRRAAAGWLAFVITAISSALALLAVLAVPSSGEQVWFEVPSLGLSMRFHIDGLSALFIAIIAIIAPACALFSITYMEHHADYGVGRYYPSFLIFLAGMYGLVAVTDTMWGFMLFWQMMTIPSYMLIRFEHRHAPSVRAANKYMLMMQIACALCMGGAALMAHEGGARRYDFDSLAHHVPDMAGTSPSLLIAGLTLFFIGFGIKAGMWPFGQIWLPDAHPAAPAPVSALLSGVMIKTGIYGLLRTFLWLLPPSGSHGSYAVGWGSALAILGTITLFTGTAGALLQNQTKRLLAFSSIGQVGYILLGIGVAVVLLPATDGPLLSAAAIALGAAMFHIINHGLFKSLLFLNSGSMHWATDTQDINRLGGLWRWMPVTGMTALVAAFSVSGVPLTNGFASKWGICAGAILGAPGIGYLVPCAAVAILTSALTLATFIKFFGASFLTRTSAWVGERLQDRRSLEVGWLMAVPQCLLAYGCVVLGLVPAVGFNLVKAALANGTGGIHEGVMANWPLREEAFFGVGLSGGGAVLAPAALLVVLGLCLLFARLISRLGASKASRAEPWLCGYAKEADCHRYRADGFYRELVRYLGWTRADKGVPTAQRIIEGGRVDPGRDE